MDAEFGLEELVKEELKKEKNQAYTTKDLKNLTVEHDIVSKMGITLLPINLYFCCLYSTFTLLLQDNFTEGRQVILTLKDKGVLDEEDDSLVNVNLLDEERYKKVCSFPFMC
jgi:U4/U6.U5 tri-snRNP-associated protein 1